MIEEIQSAVNFLTRLIAKSNDSSLLLTKESIDSFNEKLCQLLEEKYRDHWFPEKPIKGQAFRCIRINENNRRDHIVEKACVQCGIPYDHLKLPLELTLWVDPNEVTVRFGEHKGSYCIVSKFGDGLKENYIDTINIEELEKKSIERAKQASFDLLNSRKKRMQFNNNRKNGYNSNVYSNGFGDYSGIIPTTSTPSSTYYPFYANGTPFATQYGTSPPQSNVFPKYPISPPQSRSVGNTPYRSVNNKSSYSPNVMIANSKANNNNNNNFSRGLTTAFNNATIGTQLTPFSYSPHNNDRYHWVNKSKVMA